MKCRMSKVKALYHVVFCTKHRQHSINPLHKEDLYRFIWKEITENKSRLLRVGGVENHVHMLIDLHPSVALSDLIQKIKSHSSIWMKTSGKYPKFLGWASEYYGCTISPEQQNVVIEYIKNQVAHHKGVDFDSELRNIHTYANLMYDERNLR